MDVPKPGEPAFIPAETAYVLLEAGAAGPLRVRGALDYSARSERPLPPRFPAGLEAEALNFSASKILELPEGLRAYELDLSGTDVESLPDDLRVQSRLDLSGCQRLKRLPAGLTVGTLVLRGCTELRRLPEGLDVWFLSLSGCWAFDTWPATARIRSGRLLLRGCAALRSLPPYAVQLAALDVCDCPNLDRLPDELTVSGWLDLARSGLTQEQQLPPGLAHTQLRWAGVNIDRRIAFRPQTITVDEVLGERNSELRRVLLERYGYGRFLLDAHAEILDKDADPGGARQLLRVPLQDDEPLVAMSCFCPSTGRQYIIRVPPATPTCRHAAAWIAGFDNPDDYQPAIET